MARGEPYTEHGAFWFEGLRFKDDELPREPLIERVHSQRIDDVPQITDRFFRPPPSPEREERVQGHIERVAIEEPLAEPVIDWPPAVNKRGQRVR